MDLYSTLQVPCMETHMLLLKIHKQIKLSCVAEPNWEQYFSTGTEGTKWHNFDLFVGPTPKGLASKKLCHGPIFQSPDTGFMSSGWMIRSMVLVENFCLI